MEGGMCVRCVDQESNLCVRVKKKMMIQNKERKMEECKASIKVFSFQ